MGTKTNLFVDKHSGGKFIIADDSITTGNIFFVNSGNTAKGANSLGHGRDPSEPFLTIDYANDRCTASNGDIIYVMPGHTETVATDGGLTLDTAGVTVLGLGEGDARPLVSITTLAAAAMIISGAGVVFNNMRISIAIDAATDPIQISGAGCDFGFCEIIEASACEALDLISIPSTGTRCVLHDLKIQGRDTTGGDALCAIHLDGCDDVEIYNIWAYGGDWSEAVIFNEGDEVLNINIHDCKLWTTSETDVCIQGDSAATGFIGPNIYGAVKDNAANVTEAFVGAAFNFILPIEIVNAVGESSMGTNITATAE